MNDDLIDWGIDWMDAFVAKIRTTAPRIYTAYLTDDYDLVFIYINTEYPELTESQIEWIRDYFGA